MSNPSPLRPKHRYSTLARVVRNLGTAWLMIQAVLSVFQRRRR